MLISISQSRELLATGRYKFNTITTGGEIQHAVDKADRVGQAEVKMLAPDGVGGPADIVAMGIEVEDRLILQCLFSQPIDLDR